VKLLTADEVAERLSVDPSTVRAWARAGDLPAYRLGRVLRFDPELVDRWLSGQMVGTRPRVEPRQPVRGSRVTRLRAAVSAKAQAASLAAQE